MTTAVALEKSTLRAVWSPQRRNRRDIDVYLPPSYGAGRRRYPVVYMHDGQNLSNPETAFAATWQLDDVLRDLAAHGIEAIVVGVHNAGDERLTEYSPFPDRRHGGGGADRYLAFLTDTVKPRVDRLFRTARGPQRTATVGSSMGGLFSLYAWLRRPDAFSLAGVMSRRSGSHAIVSSTSSRRRLFRFERRRLPSSRADPRTCRTSLPGRNGDRGPPSPPLIHIVRRGGSGRPQCVRSTNGSDPMAGGDG